MQRSCIIVVVWPGGERARINSLTKFPILEVWNINFTMSTGSGVVTGEKGVIEIQTYQKRLHSKAKKSMNHMNIVWESSTRSHMQDMVQPSNMPQKSKGAAWLWFLINRLYRNQTWWFLQWWLITWGIAILPYVVKLKRVFLAPSSKLSNNLSKYREGGCDN